MPEPSGPAITLDEVDRHTQALFELLPKPQPKWANHDMTFGQLRLLFVLGQAGQVSIGQLADKLGVTNATASELIDRVERRGLVLRMHRADDRRVVDCKLSEDGALLLAQIQGTRQQSMRRVLGLLTAQELAEFDRLLQIMAERLSTAIQSSVSTEGGTQVNSEMSRPSPKPGAGEGRP